MTRATYFGGVIGRGLITVVGVSIVVFVAIHLVPGNFVDIMMPPELSPEAKSQFVHRYGLDQPIPFQYLDWLKSVVAGDFGTSLVSDRPVLEGLEERVPVTAELTIMAMLLALGAGVPLGVAAGLAGSRFAGLVSRLLGSAGLSVPNFVLASALVYFFSSHPLGVVIGGWVPFTMDPIENLRSMVLPAITLSILASSLIMRTTRDAVRSVLTEAYIEAAIARGESPRETILRHVLRNAAVPVITVSAVSIGGLLGGAVILENIFSIPGMGQYAFQAVQSRDYPVVQACALLGASAFVALNTIADLAYPLIDPRIGSRRAST